VLAAHLGGYRSGFLLIAAAAFGARLSPALHSGTARVALLVVGVSGVAWGQTTFQVRSRQIEPGQKLSLLDVSAPATRPVG